MFSKSAREYPLIWRAGVPDLGLAHEIEPAALHQAGLPRQHVGAEEDRGSEHALEGGYQAPVFLTSGVHTKALKHFSRGAEANRLTLLLHCKSRQENGHESILSPSVPAFPCPHAW